MDPAAAALVQRLCGSEPRVLAGPFAGMRYIRASGSGLLPKLVGSYESELHGAVLESLGRGYEVVVNVGSGEGYYAVGYARCLSQAVVHAFDADPLARQRLGMMATLNGVAARVRIGGFCSPASLQSLLGGRCLVVCDCEGGEGELLDPERVPALRGADILVEMHDFIDPSISRTLLARMDGSHEIQVLKAEERREVEGLGDLGPEDRALAVYEGRRPG
jgi:hypothetical protein